MWFFFECSGNHRYLHVLTHSFPTRRSADLSLIAMARNALDMRRAARSWGDRLGLKLNLSSVRPDRFGLPVFLHSLRAPPGRVGLVLSSGECRWVQGV